MAKQKVTRRQFLGLATAAAAGVTLAPGDQLILPARAAVAQPGPSGKLGQALIGKLEGPEIIRDPAKFPKTFQEAPALAEMVKAGKLPPVKERIGEGPLVVKPLHEIGKYGGTIRRGFTGPGDQWNGARIAGHDNVLMLEYSASQIRPNLVKDWKLAPDGRSLTLYLRRGMKWSDGAPFTADDFLFWFEDIVTNKELKPVPPSDLTYEGKLVSMEKVDTYTVRYTFPGPHYFFPYLLTAASAPGSGQAQYGRTFEGGYAPKHYLKQFHPKYVPREELETKIREAKFDNWVKHFAFKSDWALNVDLPVVSAWKTVIPAHRTTWVLERNPYSIWVDTEGNQLPYIDKIVLTMAQNLEVLNLRVIAGECDYQDRHVDLGKLPVLLENQAKGDYTVRLDPGDFGGDMYLKVNLSYDKDPEIAKWLGNADFRRALSLGIDRDQLNEGFWLGLGTPGSPIPSPANPYFPGEEYRKLWHTHDPGKANEMLDRIGLAKKDAEGYRLRADGQGRLRVELMTMSGVFMPMTQVGEMIRQQLKTIGVELVVKEVERSLANTRVLANESQLFAFSNDTSESLFTTQHQVLPVVLGGFSANTLHALWYSTNGARGKEPPERLREALAMWRKAFGVPEAERVELGKKIWAMSVEEVWHIGLVGLSPANSGVRVVKNNLGNTPERQYNSNIVRAPGGSIPEQFYWRK